MEIRRESRMGTTKLCCVGLRKGSKSGGLILAAFHASTVEGRGLWQKTTEIMKQFEEVVGE